MSVPSSSGGSNRRVAKRYISSCILDLGDASQPVEEEQELRGQQLRRKRDRDEREWRGKDQRRLGFGEGCVIRIRVGWERGTMCQSSEEGWQDVLPGTGNTTYFLSCRKFKNNKLQK